MPYCPDCGEQVDENATFCRACGGDLAAPGTNGPRMDRVERTEDVSYVCTQCGETHVRNNPPCGTCGGMNYQTVSEASGGDSSTNIGPDNRRGGGEEQSLTASAGDVLFNKSLTRQLIDLELLILTASTWIFFLITEVIYHRWRQSRGEAFKSQYSFDGGRGEGIITKGAKVLFWGQFGIIFLVVLIVFLA